MNKSYLDIPLEVKAKDINDDGTFKGYGSLFNKTPDAYGDLVAPGAFIDTLAAGGRNKTGVAMLWQHDSSKIPGVWISLDEDKRGLKTAGKLALKTSLGSDVYEIMKLGAETKTFKLGMSIGYDAVEYDTNKEKQTRTLKKVDLWELSIVTFPAKLGAVVSTVKAIEEAKNVRDLENALREAGHSKNQAQMIISVCKASLRDVEMKKRGEQELTNVLDSLKKVNDGLPIIKRVGPDGLSGILNSLKQINL